MALLPHCKDTGHVHVYPSSADGPGLDSGHIQASFLASMQCVNHPDYAGWGLLLSPVHKPGEGMHCLPPLAEALPDMLDNAASNNLGDPVVIAHTVHGDFTPWKVLTVDAAHALAASIRTVLESAP